MKKFILVIIIMLIIINSLACSTQKEVINQGPVGKSVVSPRDLSDRKIKLYAEYYMAIINGDLWAWDYNLSGLIKPTIIARQVKSVRELGYSLLVIKKDNSLWTLRQLEKKPPVYKRVMGNVKDVAFDGLVFKTDNSIWRIWNRNDKIDPEKLMDNVKSYKNYIALNKKGELWDLSKKNPKKLMNDVRMFDGHYDRNYYALKEDNTLWAWGSNHNGEVGNGRFDKGYEFSNKKNKIMENVQYVKSINNDDTWYGAYAIKKDNSLWVWGYRALNNVHKGKKGDSNRPIKVTDNVSKVYEIEGGFIAILKKNGKLFSWGYTKKYRLSDVVEVKYPAYNYSLSILTKDRSLYGVGRFNLQRMINKPVKLLSSVKYVDENYFFAILDDGSLWYYGTGKPVKYMDNVRSFSSDNDACFIARHDGTVWYLPTNFRGEVEPVEIKFEE